MPSSTRFAVSVVRPVLRGRVGRPCPEPNGQHLRPTRRGLSSSRASQQTRLPCDLAEPDRAVRSRRRRLAPAALRHDVLMGDVALDEDDKIDRLSDPACERPLPDPRKAEKTVAAAGISLPTGTSRQSCLSGVHIGLKEIRVVGEEEIPRDRGHVLELADDQDVVGDRVEAAPHRSAGVCHVIA